MLGEILQKLTGQYRGDRPTLQSLVAGTAYQPLQAPPQPQGGPQPVSFDQLAKGGLSKPTGGLSLESLGRGVSNVAGTVGDFLSGDNYRRDAEESAYNIGRLQRQAKDRDAGQELSKAILLQKMKEKGEAASKYGNPVNVDMDDGTHQVILDPYNPGKILHDFGLKKPGTGGAGGTDEFTMADKYRDEYEGYAKGFREQKKAYKKVKRAAEGGDDAAFQSGIPDITLIYAYQNIIDPGSVVRESDVQTMGRAGKLGDQAQQWFNVLLNNKGKLPPEVRKDILTLTKKQYDEETSSFKRIDNLYRGRAERRKLTLEDVIDPTIFNDEIDDYLNGGK